MYRTIEETDKVHLGHIMQHLHFLRKIHMRGQEDLHVLLQSVQCLILYCPLLLVTSME